MPPRPYTLSAACLLALLLLASCGGPAPFGAAPTPTRPPAALANKDLSRVVLQASDLPGGYVLATQLSAPGDLAQVYADNLDVHVSPVAGQEVSYALGSSATGVTQVFDNAIFVYSDTVPADQAYQGLARSFAGASLDFPALGAESVAVHSETPAIGNPNILAYSTTVVWRQDRAVVLLVASGSQVPAPQMLTLAQAIQARLLK